jgi:putative transposase
MIDRTHPLPITRQAEALGMARSTVYALPRPISDRDLDLIKRMGIEALYRKPKTTKKHPQHRVYPYLLRGLNINRPNQVFAMDITYIPMARGFVYLVAVLDWYSRKVLSLRVSITMDVHFCLEAREEAIDVHGVPEIVNTDQGLAV